MNIIEETVTPGEAATLLGIDIRTIRDWISQGRIEAIKLPGNRRRIPGTVRQVWIWRSNWQMIIERPVPAKQQSVAALHL